MAELHEGVKSHIAPPEGEKSLAARTRVPGVGGEGQHRDVGRGGKRRVLAALRRDGMKDGGGPPAVLPARLCGRGSRGGRPGNGDLAIVGAPQDTVGSYHGSAFVFERNAGVWSQDARLPQRAARRDLLRIE